VRLDHLLSKEHWHLSFSAFRGWGFVKGVQVAFSQPSVLWGLLKGGTSIIWHCCSGGCCEYWFDPLGLAEESGALGVVVLGTLLGPEGSGILLRFFSVGLTFSRTVMS
jgi:hypothetical protein